MSNLDSMYSYRKAYLEKNIEFFLKDKPAGYQLCPTDEDKLLSYMHYHGHDCIRKIYKLLDLQDGAKVLDAGSGYAGPARFWVDQLNGTHEITCMEVFEDTHKLAQHMTEKVVKFSKEGLEQQLKFVQDDLVTCDFSKFEEFDAIFSVLVVLHIESSKRVDLFKNLYKSLKPGGKIFLECFCFPEDASKYDNILSICGESTSFGVLPTRAEYLGHLRAAGFEVVESQDPTASFTTFTKERHEAYLAKYETYCQFYGKELADQSRDFMGNMYQGFLAGVEGIQILAKKPE